MDLLRQWEAYLEYVVPGIDKICIVQLGDLASSLYYLIV